MSARRQPAFDLEGNRMDPVSMGDWIASGLFDLDAGRQAIHSSLPLEVPLGPKRNISLGKALGYKGHASYPTYILHRIGGSALFIFFTVYILGLLGVESMHVLMRSWFFQVVFLVFGLFHVVNGLRITILDLSPKLMEHVRTAINIEWAAYVLVAGFALFLVLRNAFGS